MRETISVKLGRQLSIRLSLLGFRMPSRENKTPRVVETTRSPRHDGTVDQRFNKPKGQQLPPGRTHTRINAFITSMGRRNQAKRDSR